jgi:cytochrome c-type biogenesis protein CcmH
MKVLKDMGKILLISVALSFLWSCGAPSNDPEARAERIGQKLRCPVCRGVPIADSPSELARQMMEVVRRQIAEGKSDEEILKYFEERYGEWALLQPKPEGMNLAIWILPVGFLLGGAAVILIRLKKRR